MDQKELSNIKYVFETKLSLESILCSKSEMCQPGEVFAVSVGFKAHQHNLGHMYRNRKETEKKQKILFWLTTGAANTKHFHGSKPDLMELRNA
jgi:hypothetical protein